MRDYSFENKITEGKIQKIEKIVFEFNKVSVSFVDLYNGKRKLLIIDDVTSVVMQPDCEETPDVMAYETLIGYDFWKEGELYIVCVKTDSYEIAVRSYSEPKLTVCL